MTEFRVGDRVRLSPEGLTHMGKFVRFRTWESTVEFTNGWGVGAIFTTDGNGWPRPEYLERVPEEEPKAEVRRVPVGIYPDYKPIEMISAADYDRVVAERDDAIKHRDRWEQQAKYLEGELTKESVAHDRLRKDHDMLTQKYDQLWKQEEKLRQEWIAWRNRIRLLHVDLHDALEPEEL